jgi:hypothetical protein
MLPLLAPININQYKNGVFLNRKETIGQLQFFYSPPDSYPNKSGYNSKNKGLFIPPSALLICSPPPLFADRPLPLPHEGWRPAYA